MNIFLQGNVLDVLNGLPSELFHCVVTSPPYWGLRKYKGEQELIWGGDEKCKHEWSSGVEAGDNRFRAPSSSIVGANANPGITAGGKMLSQFCLACGAWKGALGLEPSPDCGRSGLKLCHSCYVCHSIEILREVRRVLRPDGVCWWNIGDSYHGGHRKSSLPNMKQRGSEMDYTPSRDFDHPFIKPLDLCMIPQRLAIALQGDGWYVRSWIVWSKGNSMPESVNGWRWEQHKVKVGNRGRSIKRAEPNTDSRNVEAWRVETGQQDHDSDGGFLSDAIWQDCPGCFKCSPNDGYVLCKGSWRPTDAHEYILMLTKTNSYYCDKDAVVEPVAQSSIERVKYPFNTTFVAGRSVNSRPDGDMSQFVSPSGRNPRSVWKDNDSDGVPEAQLLAYNTKYIDDGTGLTPQGFSRNKTIERERAQSRLDAKVLFPNDSQMQQDYINFIHNHHSLGGRNPRSVWEDDVGSTNLWNINTKSFLGAHFAVFPEKLPEICVKVSTSEKGCCPKCGAPWARIVSRRVVGELEDRPYCGSGQLRSNGTEGGQGTQHSSLGQQDKIEKQTLGWRPTCSCNVSDPIPCRVLDPFSGSGTTALVCEQLGRDSVNIDISASYIVMSKLRLAKAEAKRQIDTAKQVAGKVTATRRENNKI